MRASAMAIGLYLQATAMAIRLYSQATAMAIGLYSQATATLKEDGTGRIYEDAEALYSESL